jgi:hypothetical protein
MSPVTYNMYILYREASFLYTVEISVMITVKLMTNHQKYGNRKIYFPLRFKCGLVFCSTVAVKYLILKDKILHGLVHCTSTAR